MSGIPVFISDDPHAIKFETVPAGTKGAIPITGIEGGGGGAPSWEDYVLLGVSNVSIAGDMVYDGDLYAKRRSDVYVTNEGILCITLDESEAVTEAVALEGEWVKVTLPSADESIGMDIRPLFSADTRIFPYTRCKLQVSTTPDFYEYIELTRSINGYSGKIGNGTLYIRMVGVDSDLPDIPFKIDGSVYWLRGSENRTEATWIKTGEHDYGDFSSEFGYYIMPQLDTSEAGLASIINDGLVITNVRGDEPN